MQTSNLVSTFSYTSNFTGRYIMLGMDNQVRQQPIIVRELYAWQYFDNVAYIKPST